MRRSTLIVSALLCAVCVVDSAAAQLPALQSGTRVRVTPGGRAKPTIGIVETLSTDAISLRGNGAVGSVIPLSSVSRLEISLGKKRPTWSKTAPLWMPLAGIGTGAAIGHLSSENNTAGVERASDKPSVYLAPDAHGLAFGLRARF